MYSLSENLKIWNPLGSKSVYLLFLWHDVLFICVFGELFELIFAWVHGNHANFIRETLWLLLLLLKLALSTSVLSETPWLMSEHRLPSLALAQGWSSRLQYSSQPLPSGKHCTSHLLTAPSSWLCFQLTLWLRAEVGAKACRAVASWRVPFLLISPAIYLQSTRYLKRDVFFNAKSFSNQHSVWHCIYLRNG